MKTNINKFVAISGVLLFCFVTLACGGPTNQKSCDEMINSLRSFLKTEVQGDVRSGKPLEAETIKNLIHYDQLVSECGENARTVPSIDYYFRVSSETNFMLKLFRADGKNEDRIIRKHLLKSLDRVLQIRRRQ